MDFFAAYGGRFLNALLSTALVAILLVLAPVAAYAQPDSDVKLTYLTEQYYPYNYIENGIMKGVSVDVLKLVWNELGVAEQPILLMPWARAYDLVRNQSGTVAFSMARTPEREGLFRWAGPIEKVRFVLLAKKGRNIRIDSYADLKGHAIGMLIDDVTAVILDSIKKYARLEPVSDMRFSLKMINHDRIDLIAYEEASFARLAMANRYDPQEYETVFVLEETGVYYAFHLSVPESFVERFQQALDAVKAGPEYGEVLDRYWAYP